METPNYPPATSSTLLSQRMTKSEPGQEWEHFLLPLAGWGQTTSYLTQQEPQVSKNTTASAQFHLRLPWPFGHSHLLLLPLLPIPEKLLK